MTTVIEFYVSDKQRKITIKQLSNHFDKSNSGLIEKGIYDYTEQFCKSNNNNLIMATAIYKDCSGNILFNLIDNNETIKKLKKDISKKKFNAYNIAFLTPNELNEGNWHKIILRKKTTEDKLSNLPTIEYKPCRACKNTEYFYYQLQTRSADEPMTTFYICKTCEKTIKVNN